MQEKKAIRPVGNSYRVFNFALCSSAAALKTVYRYDETVHLSTRNPFAQLQGLLKLVRLNRA